MSADPNPTLRQEMIARMENLAKRHHDIAVRAKQDIQYSQGKRKEVLESLRDIAISNFNAAKEFKRRADMLRSGKTIEVVDSGHVGAHSQRRREEWKK